jgi:hypothetical protein
MSAGSVARTVATMMDDVVDAGSQERDADKTPTISMDRRIVDHTINTGDY